jgi:hypothetical protein
MEDIDLTELYEKIYTPERIKENEKIAGGIEAGARPQLTNVDGRTKLTLPCFEPLFRIRRGTYSARDRTYLLHIEKSSLPVIAIVPNTVEVYLPKGTEKVRVIMYTSKP